MDKWVLARFFYDITPEHQSSTFASWRCPIYTCSSRWLRFCRRLRRLQFLEVLALISRLYNGRFVATAGQHCTTTSGRELMSQGWVLMMWGYIVKQYTFDGKGGDKHLLVWRSEDQFGFHKYPSIFIQIMTSYNRDV